MAKKNKKKVTSTKKTNTKTNKNKATVSKTNKNKTTTSKTNKNKAVVSKTNKNKTTTSKASKNKTTVSKTSKNKVTTSKINKNKNIISKVTKNKNVVLKTNKIKKYNNINQSDILNYRSINYKNIKHGDIILLLYFKKTTRTLTTDIILVLNPNYKDKMHALNLAHINLIQLKKLFNMVYVKENKKNKSKIFDKYIVGGFAKYRKPIVKDLINPKIFYLKKIKFFLKKNNINAYRIYILKNIKWAKIVTLKQ